MNKTWVAWDDDRNDGDQPLDVVNEWELETDAVVSDNPKSIPGVFAEIGALPPGALITEEGLAQLFGRCMATIRNAVERGELPRPARMMGKPTWTAGAIVTHHQQRLEAEAKKYAKLRN
jgi:hypothetical protein